MPIIMPMPYPVSSGGSELVLSPIGGKLFVIGGCIALTTFIIVALCMAINLLTDDDGFGDVALKAAGVFIIGMVIWIIGLVLCMIGV